MLPPYQNGCTVACFSLLAAVCVSSPLSIAPLLGRENHHGCRDWLVLPPTMHFCAAALISCSSHFISTLVVCCQLFLAQFFFRIRSSISCGRSVLQWLSRNLCVTFILHRLTVWCMSHCDWLSAVCFGHGFFFYFTFWCYYQTGMLLILLPLS